MVLYKWSAKPTFTKYETLKAFEFKTDMEVISANGNAWKIVELQKDWAMVLYKWNTNPTFTKYETLKAFEFNKSVEAVEVKFKIGEQVSYINSKWNTVVGEIIEKTPKGEYPRKGSVMIETKDGTIFSIEKANLEAGITKREKIYNSTRLNNILSKINGMFSWMKTRMQGLVENIKSFFQKSDRTTIEETAIKEEIEVEKQLAKTPAEKEAILETEAVFNEWKNQLEVKPVEKNVSQFEVGNKVLYFNKKWTKVSGEIIESTPEWVKPETWLVMIKGEDGTIFSISEVNLQKGVKNAKWEKIYRSTKLDVVVNSLKNVSSWMGMKIQWLVSRVNLFFQNTGRTAADKAILEADINAQKKWNATEAEKKAVVKVEEVFDEVKNNLEVEPTTKVVDIAELERKITQFDAQIMSKTGIVIGGKNYKLVYVSAWKWAWKWEWQMIVDGKIETWWAKSGTEVLPDNSSGNRIRNRYYELRNMYVEQKTVEDIQNWDNATYIQKLEELRQNPAFESRKADIDKFINTIKTHPDQFDAVIKKNVVDLFTKIAA